MFLIPILLGVFTVLQAGLNRVAGARLGLATIVMINSATLLCTSIAWWLWARGQGPDSSLARLSGGFRAWDFTIGLLGFGIVAGIPLTLARVGATQVFVLMVAAQLAAALIWDQMLEGRPFDLVRAGGVALAFLGAWISSSR